MVDESNSLDRSDIQRRAVQGAGWTLIHTVVSIPVAFVVNLVVARVLGVIDYGRLAYLSTIMDIVGAILSVGLGTALVQYGARRHATRKYSEVEHLLSISQGFRLYFVAPVLTIVVLLLVDVPPVLMVVAIVFGVILPNTFGGASAGLSIENKTASDARYAMLDNLITQGAVVTAVLIAGQADVVWSARIAASGIAAALFLIPLLPRYRRAVIRPKWPRGFPKGFWRFAIPTGISMLIAQLVVTRTEVLFLDVLSTPAEVGIFALAFGVASNVFAPAQSITGPLIPALSSLTETTDRQTMARAFLRTIRASSTVSALLIAGGIPAIAALVPLLYGHEFSSATLPVLVLGCTGGVAVASTPVIAFTLARLSARRLLSVNLISLAVNVILAVTLIPGLGVWGAVIANAGGVLVRMAILLDGEARALALPLRSILALLTPVAVGIASAWLAWGAATLTDLPGLVEAVLCGVIGLTAVLVLLRLFSSGLEMADAQAILHAAPRGTRTVLRLLLSFVTRR